MCITILESCSSASFGTKLPFVSHSQQDEHTHAHTHMHAYMSAYTHILTNNSRSIRTWSVVFVFTFLQKLYLKFTHITNIFFYLQINTLKCKQQFILWGVVQDIMYDSFSLANKRMHIQLTAFSHILKINNNKKVIKYIN